MNEVVRPSDEHHFNELTPAQDESLTLVMEEASEVNVSIAKIQRHGLFSWNPFDPKKVANITSLNEEVGDLLAALRVAEVQGLLDWGKVINARDRKLQELPKWLHHAKVWKYRDETPEEQDEDGRR